MLFSLAPIYLQQPWVKEMLNVGNRSWYDREDEIAVSSIIDDEESFMYHIPNALAKGVRVLTYK